jgi:CRP/FNR family transcriptional regulator, cyclic AMP receptor protein
MAIAQRGSIKRIFGVMAQSEAGAFIAMCGGGAIARYGARSIIYAQGDVADSILYIIQGQVKVSVFSERGKEAIVTILKPGDFCGEDCLGGQEFRMSSVTTINECAIVQLKKSSVVRALHENLSISDYLIQYLLARNIWLKQHLIEFILYSGEKRLARALLQLASVGEKAEEQNVISNIDQESLASLIGTTRGRVNYFMNKFRKMGFIEYRGNDIRVQASLLNVVQQDLPECP